MPNSACWPQRTCLIRGEGSGLAKQPVHLGPADLADALGHPAAVRFSGLTLEVPLVLTFYAIPVVALGHGFVLPSGPAGIAGRIGAHRTPRDHRKERVRPDTRRSDVVAVNFAPTVNVVDSSGKLDKVPPQFVQACPLFVGEEVGTGVQGSPRSE